MATDLFSIDIEINKCDTNNSVVASPTVGVINIELQDICDNQTETPPGEIKLFDCAMYSGIYSTSGIYLYKTLSSDLYSGVYQTNELTITTYINLPAGGIRHGLESSSSLTTSCAFNSNHYSGLYSVLGKLKIYPQFSVNHSFGQYSYNKMLISFTTNHRLGQTSETNTIAISGISFDPTDMYFGLDCSSRIPTLFKTTAYFGLHQTQELKTDRLFKPIGYYHGFNCYVYKTYTTPKHINLYPSRHLLGFISKIYSEETETLEVCNLNDSIFYNDGTELHFNKTSRTGCGDKTSGCSLSITDHSYKSDQSFGLSSYSSLNGVLTNTHYTNSLSSQCKLTTSDLIRLCGVQPDYNTGNVYLEVTDVVLCPHKITNEFGSHSISSLSTTQSLSSINYYHGLYSYRTNLDRDLVFGGHRFGTYSTSSLSVKTDYSSTHAHGLYCSTYTLSIEAAVFSHGLYSTSELTKYKKIYDICLDYVPDEGLDNSDNWIVSTDPDADKFIPTGLIEDPNAWPEMKGKIVEVTNGDKVFIDFSTV